MGRKDTQDIAYITELAHRVGYHYVVMYKDKKTGRYCYYAETIDHTRTKQYYTQGAFIKMLVSKLQK